MPLQLQLELTLLLLLAAFLGMVIGVEREAKAHAAGMRTHMLVCLGSCLFTILSEYAFEPGDPGRVASQILPGIGFLGAGIILERQASVKNLTTAAGVWSTAAIGMAVGSGAWFLAIVATVMVWLILAILFRFELRYLGTKNNTNDE
jgi:putative Mg2+ transporter-C (MgtC) family protein